MAPSSIKNGDRVMVQEPFFRVVNVQLNGSAIAFPSVRIDNPLLLSINGSPPSLIIAIIDTIIIDTIIIILQTRRYWRSVC